MPSEGSDAQVVEKGECPKCGSWRGRVLYDDGHYWCFACPPDEAFTAPEGGEGPRVPKTPKAPKEYQADLDRLLEGTTTRNLPLWNIQQATCKHANYLTKVLPDGTGQHIAVYKDEHGEVVFCKVRKVTPADSKVGFFGIGDQSAVSLYGIETLKGGKMVVVAEGEKDRLTGLQLWANKWPVVSIPFGAESSGNAFAKALPLLCKYDKVILALDMDKQGREGAEALARMLPPGKAFIAEFPSHDLTDMVAEHGGEATIRALHNAKPFSPDGIVDADDLDEALLEAPSWGASLPIPELTEWTYGMKPGQVWVGGAGVGMGKSDLAAEIIAHHIKPVEDGGNYQRAAVFNYESDAVETLRLILTKLWSKNFGVPNPKDGSVNVYWQQEDLLAARAYRREKCAKLFVNDHKGAVDWDSIKDRLRYLKHAASITLAVIDPMAALVAREDDDRKALDKLLAEAKGLAEELGITILFMSHMARPKEGKAHEEGGRVTMAQFRGSGAIVMWADVVWGLERNTQDEDEFERTVTTIRMLKIRRAGQHNGKTTRRAYSATSGRLEEIVTGLPIVNQDGAELPPPPLENE